MHLTSSLGPAGPESTGHYLILHHDKRHDLIKLPETYSDLKLVVAKLYNLQCFFIESKELNFCPGERIKIPESLWGDVAKVLANVYIVEDGNVTLPGSLPKSVPGADSHPNPEQHTTNQQLTNIRLEKPLVNDEYVVVNIGNIALEGNLPTTNKIDIMLLDEKNDAALTIGVICHSEITFFTSTPKSKDTRTISPPKDTKADHHLLVFKQETRFIVLYEWNVVGSVEATPHSALTSIVYDKGPISANVHPNLAHLRNGFEQYRSTFPLLRKDGVYQQILDCDPGRAERTLVVLGRISKECSIFKHSPSGIHWQSQELLFDKWTDLKWGYQPRSVFLIRYSLSEDIPGRFDIDFGPQSAGNALQLNTHTGFTTFYEFNLQNGIDRSCTFTHSKAMTKAGDHSIALVNDGGKIRVIFDFKESTTLPNFTLFHRRPFDIHTKIPNSRVEGDIYEFGA